MLVCVFGMATIRCTGHVDGRKKARLETRVSYIKVKLRVDHRRRKTNSLIPKYGIDNGIITNRWDKDRTSGTVMRKGESVTIK